MPSYTLRVEECGGSSGDLVTVWAFPCLLPQDFALRLRGMSQGCLPCLWHCHLHMRRLSPGPGCRGCLPWSPAFPGLCLCSALSCSSVSPLTACSPSTNLWHSAPPCPPPDPCGMLPEVCPCPLMVPCPLPCRPAAVSPGASLPCPGHHTQKCLVCDPITLSQRSLL